MARTPPALPAQQASTRHSALQLAVLASQVLRRQRVLTSALNALQIPTRPVVLAPAQPARRPSPCRILVQRPHPTVRWPLALRTQFACRMIPAALARRDQYRCPSLPAPLARRENIQRGVQVFMAASPVSQALTVTWVRRPAACAQRDHTTAHLG